MGVVSGIRIKVESRTDRAGLRLRYKNTSDAVVQVTIPHPRAQIFLRDAQGEVPMEFYPLVWEALPPVQLVPGQELTVRIRLTTYWTSLNGSFLAICRVHLVSAERTSEVEVTGEIDLELPSRDELRHRARARDFVADKLQVIEGQDSDEIVFGIDPWQDQALPP